jgi:hypothetical protein
MADKLPIDHPYKKFEATGLWRTIEKQVAALVKNGDIQELTAREYIVGSICRAIDGTEDPK